MKSNNEIRFKTTTELVNTTESLWKEAFFYLKKSAFYQKVFLLGLNEIKKQIVKQRQQIKK